ncbi:hypothetical protein KR52_09060 [Synechococcus sp. KORDI-52]|nr:hypothetical protein KR52_09060 [Synechococcus sp. KORDI-52]
MPDDPPLLKERRYLRKDALPTSCGNHSKAKAGNGCRLLPGVQRLRSDSLT